MILIVTNRLDHTADWLILELERRGTAFVRFNTEDFPGATSLSWRDDRRCVLGFGRSEADLSQITAVWYRRPIPPDPAIWSDAGRARWAMGESRAALDGVWRSLDAHWVNHPDQNRIAGAKLGQLGRARQIGLRVPRTLVTNQRTALRAFAQEVGSDLVCKPIEDGQIELEGHDRLFFTTSLDVQPEDPLDDLGPEPYLFQERVAKLYDVRVTVIGGTAFATRIESQATAAGQTDWRIAGAEAKHTVEILPASVAAQCVALTRSYGLEFSAIDLARADDGSYTFFEINPNGQWAWIEQMTGQPLRATMADLLEAAHGD